MGSIQYAKKNDESSQDWGNANGRLTVRSINKLVKKIGELHDAEQEGERKINGLHSHMLRHTFGFRLAEETNKDKFGLQRRLGHQSESYIRVYTIPTRDTLNRQLRSGVNDEQLADLVIDLRADNRLCQVQEQHEPEEPRIICSLGLFDVVNAS